MGDHSDGGRGLSCNRWVAGSSPRYVCLSHRVPGQDTSPTLPTEGWSEGSVVPIVWQPHICQGSCGYIVAHQWTNGWMTDCSVNLFEVSGDLIRAVQVQAVYHFIFSSFSSICCHL
ncbi:hypothetical protein XENORESO_014845 [Xenotaenia resolanae]|uniref:Uncharacterized protein n=1 Tax=Xenotaenia resolanae TaxID=208358 RepID=A0ABV0VYE9_9TELE